MKRQTLLAAAALTVAAPVWGKVPMKTAIIREELLPPAPFTAVTGRDPFNWPPRQKKRFTAIEQEKAADPLAGVRLEGIIYSATRPLALINGSILETGEKIAGYRITAITHNMVSLRRGRITRNLKLPAPVLRAGTVKEGGK